MKAMGRPKMRLELSNETRRRLEIMRKDIQDKLGDLAQQEKLSQKLRERWERVLRLKTDKLLAIIYAATGDLSRAEIAEKLGHSTDAIQCWISDFRRWGSDAGAVARLIKTWRYRSSPIKQEEIVLAFARAILTKQVPDGNTAAVWLNANFGHKLGHKVTPKKARYWLGVMPFTPGGKERELSDEGLLKCFHERSQMFKNSEFPKKPRATSQRRPKPRATQS